VLDAKVQPNLIAGTKAIGCRVAFVWGMGRLRKGGRKLIHSDGEMGSGGKSEADHQRLFERKLGVL